MNLVKFLRITFLKNMYERLLLKTCEQTKEKWRQNLLFVWSGSIIKIKFLGQFTPWTIAPGLFPSRIIAPWTILLDDSHLGLLYCLRIVTPGQLLPRAMTITNYSFFMAYNFGKMWLTIIISLSQNINPMQQTSTWTNNRNTRLRNHSFSTYAKFSENWNFLHTDTHTDVCVSGGKKC